MHDVERITWDIVNRMMQEVDPDRAGWAVDAGLGQGDYYCEWTHNMGYQSIAIEPAPTKDAMTACKASHIKLVSAALGAEDGSATLYSAPQRDLRSLHGDLWGGMDDAGQVLVLSLPTLLRQYGIDKVTLLKLDIEGAEPDVLSTLPELSDAQLPEIVCFEFGGEGIAGSQRGPWATEHQHKVGLVTQMLRKLGYKWGVLVGSGDSLFVRRMNGKSNFCPADNWGNAIMSRYTPSDDVTQEIHLCLSLS